MKRALLRLFVAGLLAAAIAAPASATVVFSNLGPGDSFISNNGWTIGHPSGPYSQGDQFVAGSSGSLADLYIGIGKESGSDDLTVTLRADSAGLPGAILETFVIDDAAVPAFGGNSGSPVHVIASGLTSLTGGTPYWLIAETLASSHYTWNLNDQGDTGQFACCGFGGTYGAFIVTRGALRVEVDDAAAPEPGSLLLLGLGLAGLGWNRRFMRPRA